MRCRHELGWAQGRLRTVLCIALVLALTVGAESDPPLPLFRIPLLRTLRSVASVEPQFKSFDQAPGPRNMLRGINPVDPRSSIIPLRNVLNSYYTGTMTVGTPPVQMRINFDTGSGNFWVFGVEATLCRNAATTFYSAMNSSTVRPSGQAMGVTYGSGTIAGYLVTDVADLGAGLRNAAAQITVVTDCYGFGLQEFDGLLGLGYPGLSLQGQQSFLAGLVANGLLTTATSMFSFVLSSKPSEMGELIVGGVDPSTFQGSMTYTPVSGKPHWGIRIDGVRVGPELMISGPTAALVDSGTTQFLLPNSQFEALADSIGITTADCALNQFGKMPTVYVLIAGVEFPITPQQYIVDVGGSCDLGFNGISYAPSGYSIVLGDTFLRTVATVFDFGADRIGFAPIV